MSRFTSWLSLFASTGTLFCCALPSLFVVLGMGSAMAGMVSAFPQLIWLSMYKGAVFAGSGLMIALSGVMQYRARNAPCPIDKDLARACMQSRRWSMWIWIVSAGLWSVGAFFAFAAPKLL